MPGIGIVMFQGPGPMLPVSGLAGGGLSDGGALGGDGDGTGFEVGGFDAGLGDEELGDGELNDEGIEVTGFDGGGGGGAKADGIREPVVAALPAYTATPLRSAALRALIPSRARLEAPGSTLLARVDARVSAAPCMFCTWRRTTFSRPRRSKSAFCVIRSVTVTLTLDTRLSVVALRLEVSAGPRGCDALMDAVACWMDSRTLMLLNRTFGFAGSLRMALSRLASAVLTPPREAWIDPKSRLMSCSVPAVAMTLQQLVAASSRHVVRIIWAGSRERAFGNKHAQDHSVIMMASGER